MKKLFLKMLIASLDNLLKIIILGICVGFGCFLVVCPFKQHFELLQSVGILEFCGIGIGFVIVYVSLKFLILIFEVKFLEYKDE